MKEENPHRPKLRIEPFAWLQCFPGYEQDVEKIKKNFIKRIREREQHYRLQRAHLKKQVIGATTLRRQSMLKEHQPKKFARKMICISSCKELRKRFISHYKYFCAVCRAVYEAWKKGDLRPKIPPGFFPPRVPVLYSALLDIT